MALKDAKRCRAHKKDGSPCNQPAIEGRPTCRFHGGTGGRPIKHGLRSKELPVKVIEQRQSLLDNKEALLALEPMVATLKVRLANFEDIVEKDGGRWGKEELTLLSEVSEKISRIIERYHKIELATQAGIPREQVKYFTNRLISILTEELNQEQLEKVRLKVQKAATETMPI